MIFTALYCTLFYEQEAGCFVSVARGSRPGRQAQTGPTDRGYRGEPGEYEVRFDPEESFYAVIIYVLQYLLQVSTRRFISSTSRTP